MAKKIIGRIKLLLPGGKAVPGVPVGPALGQYGLNLMDFCKKFNAKTKKRAGEECRVSMIVYADKTFSFEVGPERAVTIIKKVTGIKKGSGVPNIDKIGKITRAQLEEVAKIKLDNEDINATTLDAAVRSIEGTARSMGFEIDE